MIVLANQEFALGLRLAGVKQSYPISTGKQAEEVLKDISKEEFIIATQKITEIYPLLNKYPNLIVFPDTIGDFSGIDDLKKLMRTAIGTEVEL